MCVPEQPVIHRKRGLMQRIIHPELISQNVYYNLPVPVLVEKALERKEGILLDNGALLVNTGKYTGRSAKDKFIVDTEGVHDEIAWGDVNMPVQQDVFNKLLDKAVKYLEDKEIYVFDGFAGASPAYRMHFRVINEMASQNLFIRNLLIRPTHQELKNMKDPDFTIIAVPEMKCDPETDGTVSEAAIIVDYEQRIALVAGTMYAGEIKKAVFSTMNYFMPKLGVLPMHSSANMDPVTHETAIFFGLSGTGKTTLSADPDRRLIGDDEHGWSNEGVFNFEGGCYAKCIDLSEQSEPEIYHAIKYGAVVENVVCDENRVPDYSDGSITENTRVGYPIEYIDNAAIPSVGGIPKVVIFLTADSFGVLPPVSRLTKEAAMYHFVTGFTSKVAGTEVGITEPVPTFSTLFGEPFMPLDASVYAAMLGQKLDLYGTKVYLINTGWTGGPYGTGKRIDLKSTRAIVTAVLNGTIEDSEFCHDERFNLDIPQSCPGVDSKLLNPKTTWADGDAYEAQADKLAEMFRENFETKYHHMPQAVIDAGPKKL